MIFFVSVWRGDQAFRTALSSHPLSRSIRLPATVSIKIVQVNNASGFSWGLTTVVISFCSVLVIALNFCEFSGRCNKSLTKRKISFAQVHLSYIITAASFMREKINSKFFSELKLLTFQVAGYRSFWHSINRPFPAIAHFCCTSLDFLCI